MALCAAVTLGLSGCGLGNSGTTRAGGTGVGIGAAAPGGIAGKAFGGYQPIIGATATLWESQNNGYGGSALLLQTASATTDVNGAFSFTEVGAACTNGDEIYVTIAGGNSGAGSYNSSILEAAPVETCAGSKIVAATTIVNELTTVAFGYALGNFATVTGSGTSAAVNLSVPPNNNYSPVSGATVPNVGNCTSTATFVTTGSNNVSTGTVCTASGFAHAVQNALNIVPTTVQTSSANTVVPANTSINIAASSGSGAAATAVLSGGTSGTVTAVNVTAGGSNYGSAPIVSFSTSGSTTAATATAVLSGNTVGSVTVNTAGVAYTSVPTVTFTPAGPGAVSTATPSSSVPAPLINTIADILQGCVNSSGPNPYLVFPAGTGTSAVTLQNATDTVSGTFTLSINGGTGIPVTVTSGSSLSSAISQINSALSATTVSASTIGTTDITLTDSVSSDALTFTGTATNTSNLLDTNATAGTTTCGKLFALTPSLAAVTPINTLQAVMNMAKNPYVSSSNVTSLYGLLTPQTVFSPTLTAAPHDWTIAISYQVPLPTVAGNAVTTGHPYSVDLDADDNVYTATEAQQDATSSTIASDACFVSYKADGTLRYGGVAGCNVIPNSSNYLAVIPDALGNLWVNNYNGSGTSAAGFRILRFVSSTGASASPATYLPADGTARVFAMAIDKNNDVDFSVNSNSTSHWDLQQLTNTSGTWSTASTTPIGTTKAPFTASPHFLALDTGNNIWGTEYGSSSSAQGGAVSVLPSTSATTPTYADATTPVKQTAMGNGCTTTPSTNNSAPYGVAIDANGNAWATNTGAGNVADPQIAEFVPTFTSGLLSSVTAGTVLNTITGSGATATATLSGATVGSIAVGSTGSNYTTAGVSLCGGVGTGTVALASATVTSGGVSSYTVNTAGTTYTTAPTVLVTPTGTNTYATAPQWDEVDGANNLWVVDAAGNHEFTNLTGTPREISQTGGFESCYNGYNAATATCSNSWSTSSHGLAIDSSGDIWYAYPTSSSNAAGVGAGRIFEIIGTAFPTWPLRAQQMPGWPAGCTKSLANGCN